MQKIILTILLTASLAFTTSKFIATKETAIVNKENGLFIYTDCKPVASYETIETLTAKTANVDLKTFESSNLSYDQLKQDIFLQLKKNSKEKFKGAEALIIYPEQQKAEVIKFKE